MNPLIEQLQHILGAAHVLSDGNLEAYEKDWRGRIRGRALCVVRPGSTDEAHLHLAYQPDIAHHIHCSRDQDSEQARE